MLNPGLKIDLNIKKRIAIFFFVFIPLISIALNTVANTWMTEVVDDSKYFNYNSTRSIAVDTNNHPHIVYGGDHLYYAYHDGSSWHYETAYTEEGNVGRPSVA